MEAMEEGPNYLQTYDIKSYETMTAITEKYNKAVDKLVESVSKCCLREYSRYHLVRYRIRREIGYNAKLSVCLCVCGKSFRAQNRL